jgi:hypothetical protein
MLRGIIIISSHNAASTEMRKAVIASAVREHCSYFLTLDVEPRGSLSAASEKV